MFGALAFLVALAVRLSIDESLPPGFPFLTFFPAVILTTMLAGLWPGILTAVLGGTAAWLLFIDQPDGGLALTPGALLAMGFYSFVVAVDIAVIHIMNVALDRLAAERNRSAALTRQTQVMFAELQHRVSNNLQVVSSLLTIQQAKVEDPAARRALEEASGRLATLGRLHRKLHDPNRGDTSMAEFLTDLCHDVLDGAGARHILCPVGAVDVDIPADRLIPLALILTELVSNALEHGFADRPGGTIWVDLRNGDGDGLLELTVRDDGAGLPEGFSLDMPTSLGLQLVEALAAQLDGRFGMAGSAERGTTATLVFRAG
ncbi:sensor histidine kinase [Azospirillum sp. sgz302134]